MASVDFPFGKTNKIVCSLMIAMGSGLAVLRLSDADYVFAGMWVFVALVNLLQLVMTSRRPAVRITDTSAFFYRGPLRQSRELHGDDIRDVASRGNKLIVTLKDGGTFTHSMAWLDKRDHARVIDTLRALTL